MVVPKQIAAFNTPEVTRELRDPTRTDHQVLVAIAQLLEENLAAVKHLDAHLAESSDSRSSVEIKTSTRGVDITCKAYAGSDILEAESAAVSSYFRVMNEVQDRLMNATATK